MLDLRADTFSIATVPEGNRSSVSATRPMPDGSPTPDSSQNFRRQLLPTSPKPDVSLLHSPLVVNRDNILQGGNLDNNGQSSVAMQVSFLVHLKDPVELLPHVVNTDSD